MALALVFIPAKGVNQVADSSPMAVVDRIESKVAALELIESRHTFHLPVQVLPDEVHEGAVVEIDFKLRPEVEEERRQEINDLQDRLIQKPDDES